MTAPIFFSDLSSDQLLAQNVQPKASTPGVAQDSAPAAGGSGPSSSSPLAGFMPILMMLVIFVPFFFLMSRRQKKETAARASLKKGDRIVTNAGIIGELVELDDKIAKVRVASGTTVQMLANVIAPYVESEKANAKDLGAKDLKEAPEKK